MSGQRLGEILVAAGAIDELQLRQALQHQKGKRLKLGEALIALGSADETQVARGLAKQSSLPFIDLGKGRISEEIIAQVPAEVAERHRAIPVLERGDKLVIAVDDPAVAFQLDDLSFVLNRQIQVALTTPSALAQRLNEAYGIELDRVGVKDPGPAEASLADDEEDAPIIRLVHQMIEKAYKRKASDIHVEPTGNRVRIRYRSDGILEEVESLPQHLSASLLSRLKIMAGLDIAERRKPQDGRIGVKIGSIDLDIRASVLPTNHGESMVMRLLDRERGLVSMAELGFGEKDQERFDRMIRRPSGIVLVTGPTGSGKTTTLYAALQELNRPDKKLITAEDPVEYSIPGINQCQVHHRIGLSFSRILRAMLRQAPNVILVGEIRDRETAEVAIQAALTGHLVFSTLHTNDAPSALTRLIDMGVQPFLVAASIIGVMGQRLIRMLCPRCKVAYEASEAELDLAKLSAEAVGGNTLYREHGCDECGGAGYRGRRGVFELMEMDPRLRDLTFQREPHVRIREEAILSGRLSTLLQDGQRKILDGRTSIREVLRVVSAAD